VPFRVAIDEKAGTLTFRKPPEVRVSGTLVYGVRYSLGA